MHEAHTLPSRNETAKQEKEVEILDLGYSLEDQGEAGEKEKEKQRPVLLYSVTRGVVVVALFPLKYSLCSALLLVTSLSIDVVQIVRYLPGCQ